MSRKLRSEWGPGLQARRILTSLASCAIVASVAAQTPFRGGTDLVSVYATVTDSNGRLVTNLRQDEFEIFDNGRKQPVSVFSNDLQPFSTVMMIDRSGSMADHFDVVRDAAMAFVDHLLPGDRVRIGSFSHEIRISPPMFTSDRADLVRILGEGMQDIGPSPVWIAIDRGMTALAPEPGRRVVLVFSDGHDDPPKGLGTITRFDDVLRRVRGNDVMIYAIGLVVVSSENPSRTWSPGLHVPRGPGPIFPKPRGPLAPKRSEGGKEKREEPDPGLRQLAGESGGGYFELTNGYNLGAVFTRVSDELHRQYWLGFRAPKLDDRLHRVDIKVKRPGVEVRARKSYVASVMR